MLTRKPRRHALALGLLSLAAAGVVAVAGSNAAPKAIPLHGHEENE